MKGLKLRKESLAKLNLPIEVFEGYLGELTMHIPWASLKTKPVLISISDLFVLAGPKSERKATEEEEREAAHRTKMDRVETAELFRQRIIPTPHSKKEHELEEVEGAPGAAPSSDDQAKGEQSERRDLQEVEVRQQVGFVTALITKIVDNVQVTIKRIHVRYEDKRSHRGHPFAVGVMLEGLQLVSTDASWMETFIVDAVDKIYKVAKLDGLSVYWIPDSPSLAPQSQTSSSATADFVGFCANFGKFLDEPPQDTVRYLVEPVSGTGKVCMLRRKIDTDKQQPKLDIALDFDAIRLKLDADQWYDGLQLVQRFVLARRAAAYRGLRPAKALDPKSSASAATWFAYTVKAKCRDLEIKRRERSWSHIMALKGKRERYLTLYQSCRLAQNQQTTNTAETEDEINNLERDFSYDQIRWFRAMARRLYQLMELEQPKRAPSPALQTAAASGWFGWLWTGSSSSTPPIDSTSAAATSSSQLELPTSDDGVRNIEEQERDLKALFDTIDYDEQVVARAENNNTFAGTAFDTDDPEARLFRVKFALGSGSLCIANVVNLPGKSVIEDGLEAVFSGLNVSIIKRPGSVRLEVALEQLSVRQALVQGSLLPTLLQVKNLSEGPSCSPLLLRPATSSPESPSPSHPSTQNEPDIRQMLLKIAWDTLPRNKDAEYEVSVELKPLHVVLDRAVFVGLGDFFTGGRNRQTLATFGQDAAAAAALQDLAAKTRAGIESSIRQHRSVDWFVDAEAPVVSLPVGDSACPAGRIFVLDLGKLSVRSKLLTRAQRESLQKLNFSSPPSGNNNAASEALTCCYDRLDVQLRHAQLTWALGWEDWHKGLLHSIVEPIDCSLAIHRSILRTPSIIPTRISATIPSLQIHFAADRYQSLVRLIDSYLVDDKKSGSSPITNNFEKKNALFKKEPLSSNTSLILSSALLPSLSAVQVDSETGEAFYEALDYHPTSPNTSYKDGDKRETEKDCVDYEFALVVETSTLDVVEDDSITQFCDDGQPRGDGRYVYGNGSIGVIQAKQWAINITDRPWDMLVSVSLHSFSLKEVMHGTTMIYGGYSAPNKNLQQQVGTRNNDNLLHVSVHLVNAKHPDFQSCYEGIRYHVTVQASALTFVADGWPLFTIFRWVRETFSTDDGNQDDSNRQTEQQLLTTSIDDLAGKLPSQTFVNFRMHKLTVKLQEAGKPCGELVFERAGMTVVYTPDALLPYPTYTGLATVSRESCQLQCRGQIRDARLRIISGGDSFFPTAAVPFLFVEGDERIEFEMAKGPCILRPHHDPKDDQNNNGNDEHGGDLEFAYGTAFKLAMGSPRINYTPEQVFVLTEWWRAFSSHIDLMDDATIPQNEEKHDDGKDELSLPVHLDIRLASPIIDVKFFGGGEESFQPGQQHHLDVDEDPLNAFLTIYLGTISATKTTGWVDDRTGQVYPQATHDSNDDHIIPLAGPDQVWNVRLQSIRMSVSSKATNEEEDDQEHFLVQETDACFRVVQVRCPASRSYANSEIIGRLEKIVLNVTRQQYTLLLDRLLFLGTTLGMATQPLTRTDNNADEADETSRQKNSSAGQPHFSLGTSSSTLIPDQTNNRDDQLSLELFLSIAQIQIGLAQEIDEQLKVENLLFTRLSLNQLSVHVTMKPEGELITDVITASLTVEDLRRSETHQRFQTFIAPPQWALHLSKTYG